MEMKEDLKLFRKRWWGAYVLIPIILLMQIPLFIGALQNISDGNIFGAIIAFIVISVCVLLCMGLYAPSTFFMAFRIIGLVVFLAYVAYAVDCLQAGKIYASKRSEIAFINAIFGLFVWGIPGLCVFLRINPMGGSEKPESYFFKSTLLEPVTEDEDPQDPWTYGEQAALWLKDKFSELGYPVEDVVPDDWGWSFICSRDPYELWIGCGNVTQDFDEDQSIPNLDEIVWCCFAEAKKPLLGKRKEISAGVQKITSQLKSLLESEPGIEMVEEP